MSNEANPYIVENLPVTTMNGVPVEGTYHLTRASVSPEIVVGRDRLGRPVTESTPTVYYRSYVHPSGTINKVPLRTGSVFSMQAEALSYEIETVTELLREGWLPLSSCCFSGEFRTITGVPTLVADPDKIGDCGGLPNGCQHVLQVAAERREIFAANAKAEEDRIMKMSPGQAGNLLRAMGEAMALARSVAEDEADETVPKRKRPA